jgi:uncharacterized membrane protein
MKELYIYLLTVPVFFGIDMIWLGLVANKFYQREIGQYLKPTPNWAAAIIFYLLYIIGILIFAVLPNVDKGPVRAAIYGALFGFFAYATYDLTNYATMKDWPLVVTITDIVWGTILTGSVALISYFIAKWIY